MEEQVVSWANDAGEGCEDSPAGLEESMWGAVTLIGTKVMGEAASTLLVVLLVVNVAIQASFIWLLSFSSLSEQSYDEGSIAGYRAWRRHDAHHVSFYDELLDRSLAARVCEGGHVLPMSANVADAYDEVDEFLAPTFLGGVSKGALMSVLALLAFYCSIAREIDAIVHTTKMTLTIPLGPKTSVKQRDDKFHIVSITRWRVAVRFGVSGLRLALAILTAVVGTKFLAYTIPLSDLFLNAVALDFVLSMDEMLFTTLAPARAQRIVANTVGFTVVHEKTWRGVDALSIAATLGVVAALASATAVVILPQQRTLGHVHHAICGGDQEGLDGLGEIAWSYPMSIPFEALSPDAITEQWEAGIEHYTLNFQDSILDAILQGVGREACPNEVCFDGTNPIDFVMKVDAPPCCHSRVALRTKVPSIVGGAFSVKKKASESLSEANAIWNSGCTDMIDPDNPFSFNRDLLEGSLGMEMQRTIDSSPCSPKEQQSCPADAALCMHDPSRGPSPPGFVPGYHCVAPLCKYASALCGESSSVGVRVRQMCSRTCECDSPRSSLALSLPESGCPARCLDTRLRSNGPLANIPCADVEPDDARFLGFLQNWEKASATWPEDWQQGSEAFIANFRAFGCGYIGMSEQARRSRNVTLPPTMNGVNPCAENGWYFPLKPLSIFCPVTCNCRAGDSYCPTTCPRRF